MTAQGKHITLHNNAGRPRKGNVPGWMHFPGNELRPTHRSPQHSIARLTIPHHMTAPCGQAGLLPELLTRERLSAPLAAPRCGGEGRIKPTWGVRPGGTLWSVPVMGGSRTTYYDTTLP